jgi:hypothetical protein
MLVRVREYLYVRALQDVGENCTSTEARSSRSRIQDGTPATFSLQNQQYGLISLFFNGLKAANDFIEN